jgi:hypothetical protein
MIWVRLETSRPALAASPISGPAMTSESAAGSSVTSGDQEQGDDEQDRQQLGEVLGVHLRRLRVHGLSERTGEVDL